MAGFEEARRQKNEETNRRIEKEANNEKDRNLRIQALRRSCETFFNGSAHDIGTRTQKDTITVHRGNADYLDVTVLNDNKYFVKAGGVGGALVGHEVVTTGKNVSGNDIYRTILDWVDGDLLT